MKILHFFERKLGINSYFFLTEYANKIIEQTINNKPIMDKAREVFGMLSLRIVFPVIEPCPKKNSPAITATVPKAAVTGVD